MSIMSMTRLHSGDAILRNAPKGIGASLKKIPGIRWDFQRSGWLIPQDAISELSSWEAPIGALIHDYQRAQGPRISEESEIQIRVPDARLREYQREGASFLANSRGAILADQMGVGKTAQAIFAWRAMPRDRPFDRSPLLIVVCPSFVRSVWRSELVKWAFGAEIPLNHPMIFLPTGAGGPDSNDLVALVAARSVIIHYDILHAWTNALTSLGRRYVVVYDEAHMLAGRTSRRFKACRELSSHDHCMRAWALTGTPLTSRLQVLYNLLDLVHPGNFGSWFQFGVRYCAGHQRMVTPTRPVWDFKGESHTEELRRRIAHYMLRRTVEDVRLELPPKMRELRRIDSDAKSVSAAMVAPTAPSFGARSAWIAKSAAQAFQSKLPALTDMLNEHLESGKRVVVFTHRRAAADKVAALASETTRAFLLTGEQSPEQRAEVLASAQAHIGPCVLACTIDSTGVGISLTSFDVAIFAELVYEPHKLLQAEARLHRFGREAPVLIQYLVALGTIDEAIQDVILQKLERFESTIGPAGDTLATDLGQVSLETAVDEIMACVARMQQGQPLAGSAERVCADIAGMLEDSDA